MGLIGGDSKNESTVNAQQQQMTAGDTSPQAKAGNSSLINIGGVTSNGKGVVGATGALTIGAENKGAITYIDSSGEVTKEALEQMAGVTKNSFELTSNLAKTFADISEGSAKATAQLTQQQLADQAARDTAVLSAITDLGKTTATGGQSDTNKTLLYVVYAVLGVAGLFLLIPVFKKMLA